MSTAEVAIWGWDRGQQPQKWAEHADKTLQRKQGGSSGAFLVLTAHPSLPQAKASKQADTLSKGLGRRMKEKPHLLPPIFCATGHFEDCLESQMRSLISGLCVGLGNLCSDPTPRQEAHYVKQVQVEGSTEH